MSDLQWYAAFHDTGHYPHIHLMVYSKGQEGYLSKQSIDSLRSCFGNDIFKQEQYHLFQLQTGLREDIKEKSRQRIQDLIAQAEAESIPNERLRFLFTKLKRQLDQHKGKKVYGYLPKDMKATVNEIVIQLSQEPAIEELYMEWNKINREKLSLYYENKDSTVPLEENKEFRSIKNMIIKAVSEMPEQGITTQLEESSDDEVTPTQSETAEETTASEPPVSAEPPPIVIHCEEPVPRDFSATAKEIVVALARLICDKCMAHRQSLQEQIDWRLKQEINEKKLAMGLKAENSQKASYQTEETYEMSM